MGACAYMCTYVGCAGEWLCSLVWAFMDNKVWYQGIPLNLELARLVRLGRVANRLLRVTCLCPQPHALGILARCIKWSSTNDRCTAMPRGVRLESQEPLHQLRENSSGDALRTWSLQPNHPQDTSVSIVCGGHLCSGWTSRLNYKAQKKATHVRGDTLRWVGEVRLHDWNVRPLKKKKHGN